MRDGQERVIAYYSKTLNKAETNSCVTRWKLLAIVRALEHLHKYLYGQQFHLRTDHSALTWLMSFKILEGQTARWIQRQQEYNFTSEHHQGRKHNNTDALSRRPCQENCMYCHKVETRADVKQVRPIAALPAVGWDPVAKRPRHRTHFTGIRNRKTTGVERHRRPESHVQKLLGSVQTTRCEKRHTRAQMEIRQRTVPSSPNSYSSEQSEGRADRKNSHRCSSAFPTERPGKPIPPDHYGLFYEVAGSVRHSESRSV
jgi:hypothetical protein